MPRDVVSYVARDMRPQGTEELVVLLICTSGQKNVQLYRDLEVIHDAFPDVDGKPSKIYNKASHLYNQGRTSMARRLYRKVKIVGFEKPATPAALIDAIEKFREIDDEWQILMTDIDDKAFQQSLIAYAQSTEPTLAELLTGIEDHRKFYVGQTTDKGFTCTNSRGAMVFVNDLDEEGDAECVGNVATFYPRRVTWKFKRPEGLTIANLSEGEKDALDDQNVNYLTKEYGFVYLKNGVCTDGEFIDALLGADYIAHRVRNKVYTLLTTVEDVSYTDNGFAQIGSAVTSALNDSVDNNIIALDPESKQGMFVVTIPTRAQCSREQAASGVMPDIFWEATIEGSVHQAVVRGVLTVNLISQAA